MSGIRKPPDFEELLVVYCTPWCGYCTAARRLLQQRQIAFAEVDVSDNQPARAWLAEQSGQSTVPQVFIRGESIGGFVELLALEHSGELMLRLAG